MKNIIKQSSVDHFRIIFFFFVCLSTSIGFTQDKQEEAALPKPIPTADIISEFDKVSTILQKINILLEPDNEVINIQKSLPKYSKSLDSLKKLPETQKINNYSNRKLQDLRQKWIIHKNNLGDWQKSLQDRSSNLENERTRLIEIKQIWEITDTAARKEKAPKQLLSKIQDLIKSVNAKEINLRKRLDKVIALQNKVMDQINIANEIITRIDETKLRKQQEIFSLDSDPLWHAFKLDENDKNFSEQLSQVYEFYTTALSDFADNYKNSMMNHLLSFLAILVFLITLKQFGNKLIMDREAADLSSEILNHPFSVAFLMALLLTRTMYPQAPGVIGEMAVTVSLIPILRLFPIFTPTKIHRYLYVFLVILILNIFYSLFPEESLFHRMTLLFLSIISGILIWQVMRSNLFKSDEELILTLKVLRFVLQLMFLFMIISFISNVIGNVVLARTLTSGSINSLYLALILVTSSQVVMGIFNLALSTRLAFFFRVVRLHAKTIRTTLSKIIYLVAIYFWLIRTLRDYNVYDIVFNWLSKIVSDRLQIGSVDISLGDILIFIGAIWVSVYLSRFIRFVLEEDILSRMKMPRGIPATISMLTNYFILGFGFIIAISAAGFDLSKLAILVGALGIGIGFGLQNIVNNFISGLILIFERPVQIGDVVDIGSLIGTVRRIGIRSSTIRTFDGAEVIVPNANLVSNEVTNWTLSDKLRRVTINIGVAYGTDPSKVLNLLKKTVQSHDFVLEKPEPLFLFEEFGDSSLNFSVRFWTNSSDWLNFKSDITVAINNALKKAGIEIPFPQQDLHLRSVDDGILPLNTPKDRRKNTKITGSTSKKRTSKAGKETEDRIEEDDSS